MLTNLKTAMMLRGIRGYELAAKVGIHAPALSEIIQGRRKPSPEVRRRVTRVLKAPENWLFAEATIPTASAKPECAVVQAGGQA